MDETSTTLGHDAGSHDGAPDEKTDKLNYLIDLVGELVIASASANLLASRSGQSVLAEANSVVSNLVEKVRDTALQMRMVKVGATFERIESATRDMAKELDKEIDLVLFGTATELDKSVLEKIGDPLMQLVRNAVCHGIEPIEDRLALGKPLAGRIELRALNESGSIVIEVVDDGGGLDKDLIRAAAIANGLIHQNDSLTDQEIMNLIFDPGLCAGENTSKLSGACAGMDAVRKSIETLRGTVEVKAELGQGSRFIVRLPLTLAIIDGFLTGVGKSSYVIPLDLVVECIELSGSTEGLDYLNLRGEVLSFVRLRDIFDTVGEHPPRENVVVVQYAGQKAGIVVDQLLGEFQTVIKPLGVLFRNVRGISGSTILGSGEVALILDVQALVSRTASIEEQHARHAQGTKLLEVQ